MVERRSGALIVGSSVFATTTEVPNGARRQAECQSWRRGRAPEARTNSREVAFSEVIAAARGGSDNPMREDARVCSDITAERVRRSGGAYVELIVNGGDNGIVVMNRAPAVGSEPASVAAVESDRQ